jgi:hypothetical protein
MHFKAFHFYGHLLRHFNTYTVRNAKTYIFGILAISGIIYLYFNNPEEAKHTLLSCPLNSFTGLQCPGCGSQRAIHQLLHLNLKAAWAFNPLLICGLPYILLAFFMDFRKPKGRFWINVKKYFFGSIAMYILLALVSLFTIFRNL